MPFAVEVIPGTGLTTEQFRNRSSGCLRWLQPYGYRARYGVASSVNAAAAELRGKGASQGVDIRVQIENETTQIRRLMTERYKVNF
jgi:hypothetical protein